MTPVINTDMFPKKNIHIFIKIIFVHLYFVSFFGMPYSSLNNQKEEGERGEEEGKLRRRESEPSLQVRKLAR